MEDATTKPTLPWKVRLSLFLLSTFTTASRRSNDTVNRRLFNLLDRKLPPNPVPVNGVSSTDVTVDSTRNLSCRLFIPSLAAVSTASLPVIVYFHGGAFSFFSAASTPYDALCRLFCRSLNAVIVSVNYRLSPEHRYPSQYNDGYDVLKFLDENQNGTVLPNFADVTRCFLAGDSSGANLAHHVAVRVCKERLRMVNVIGLISIQPFFGGEKRTNSEIRFKCDTIVSPDKMNWHWKAFLPNGSDRDHGAVNVSGPNAFDISGLDYPNTIMFMGGFDPLRDWQMKYFEWLKKSEKDAQLINYPSMFHAFYFFPELPETSMFISHIRDFMTKQMSHVD